MNILTPTEISECLTGGPTAVARAIEAAVIRKLAAGVSVELTKLCTDNRGTTHYGYTEDQLAAAIAAARVQENERCAHFAIHKSWSDSTDLAKQFRALLGKEQS